MRARYAVLFVSLSCVVGAQVAHAQALLAPVENLVINRAEAAIIQRVAIARGFAANDPRIAATLTGMGAASTALNVVSTGVAVGLGFAGAPVWLTIAAGMGILAAGTALYAGSVSLSRSFDGKTITVQQPLPQGVGNGYIGTAAPDPGANNMVNPWLWAGSVGIPVYHTASCQPGNPCAALPAAPTTGQKNFDWVAGDFEIIPNTIAQVQQFENYNDTYSANSGSSNPPAGADKIVMTSVTWQSNLDGTTQTLTKNTTYSHQQYDPNSGTYTTQYLSNSFPLSQYTIGPGVAPVSGSDLSQIYPKMTASALATPLDPNTLAQLTNQSWQQAANQPGYQGLPYSVTQPVSYSDVQPWVASNPTAAPNVGDLFRPATDPNVTTVVISPTVQPGDSSAPTPGSGTSTGTGSNVNVVNTPNVNVINKVSVDLGADPGVQSPSMEATPTISAILSPLLNLLPDLKAWSVPAHTSACPEPVFSVFGHSYTMTAQCDLAEQNRTAIYTAFAAMFTLGALFIVLRA
ncbi:MAG: hypothetical protein EPN73_03270 [Paraburkholderia sp.]|uniref:hypothetical protein n=1 Tax=Paraburkholderia sp. TaxID=1926495 RepID=UPI00121B784E|nr:hypothetical protein [Paraburkholderia sp.]TAL98236.1 MAG: hypothetical protein EPN73_03270 [Paraburkholderia sp.]